MRVFLFFFVIFGVLCAGCGSQISQAATPSTNAIRQPGILEPSCGGVKFDLSARAVTALGHWKDHLSPLVMSEMSRAVYGLLYGEYCSSAVITLRYNQGWDMFTCQARIYDATSGHVRIIHGEGGVDHEWAIEDFIQGGDEIICSSDIGDHYLRLRSMAQRVAADRGIVHIPFDVKPDSISLPSMYVFVSNTHADTTMLLHDYEMAYGWLGYAINMELNEPRGGFDAHRVAESTACAVIAGVAILDQECLYAHLFDN